VVNNLYGMGTTVNESAANPNISERGPVYGMHGLRVDGMDVMAMRRATEQAMDRARKGEPTLMEAITYRYRGHSVADAGLSYRTRDEIDAWKGKDPIALMRGRLVDQGVSDDELIALEREVADRVDAAVAYATADEAPRVEELAAGVYAPGSAEQFERMRPGSPFGELDLVFDAGLGR
jgi:TPP-dependent pyruvate/acetoin dehydrogenase alpha subunit